MYRIEPTALKSWFSSNTSFSKTNINRFVNCPEWLALFFEQQRDRQDCEESCNSPESLKMEDWEEAENSKCLNLLSMVGIKLIALVIMDWKTTKRRPQNWKLKSIKWRPCLMNIWEKRTPSVEWVASRRISIPPVSSNPTEIKVGNGRQQDIAF